MGRPKGAKNKTLVEKVEAVIEEVKKLPVDETEKAEAIDELDDLLAGSPSTVPVEPTDDAESGEPSLGNSDDKPKVMIGYHPVTGKPVYK